MRGIRGLWLASSLLVLVTVVVFGQIISHDFINYDDTWYMTDNYVVQEGFTKDSVLWALTTLHFGAGSWHPLTWFSHMLDVELYGLNPHGHHLTSLLFHIANVLLLFFLLYRMTRIIWPSAGVAVLFAVHPLHVESVAWVAERKDVLSTFFGLLTLWAYLRSIEHPGWKSRLAVALLFTMSLLAKPMLVTLPFVFLLLDYWPLKRITIGNTSNAFRRPGLSNLVWEKLPLFALAAASCLITYISQKSGGMVGSTEEYPLGIRIENALVSYAHYIEKMLWPLGLANFYPHPGNTLSILEAAGSAALLFAISFLALRTIRSHPYLIVGWFWYLGTLVPVIGLVQVGSQGMADRYSYIPLVGLFLMMAWGVADLYERSGHLRPVIGLGCSVYLLLLVVLSVQQAGFWRNSLSLFGHALEVTSNNYLAHNNLGVALAAIGKTEEAVAHYGKALSINPTFALAHVNLGSALASQGKWEEATNHLVRAMQLRPDLFIAYTNLGIVLANQGKLTEAINQFNQAILLRPDSPLAHYDLGLALFGQTKYTEAAMHFSQAVRLKPDFELAHNSLGVSYYRLGRLKDAIHEYRTAITINPQFELARNNLETVYREQREQQRVEK